VVETYRKVVLYCSGESVNEVILLCCCWFCLSRGTKCNGVRGHRLRSKAIWTVGSKRESQLYALSASRSSGLRNCKKWNNQMFRKFFEIKISVRCTTRWVQAVGWLGYRLSDRGKFRPYGD
jgi:hypothetical protein